MDDPRLDRARPDNARAGVVRADDARAGVVRAPDGARLAVLEVGAAHAPAVVVAHGVGSSARFVIDALGPALTGAGWRLAAWDLRGHGGSDRGTEPGCFRVDAVARDLVAVAEWVGADVVGGVSLGAAAAVRATGGLPDLRAAVALLPAWTGRAVPGEGLHAAVAAAVRADGVPAVVGRFRDDSALPAWLRDVLVRDWSRADPASLVAALTALDGGAAPTPAEIAELRPPLGVVGWRDDAAHPLVVARDWAAAARPSALVEADLADPRSLGVSARAILADLRLSP